MRNALIGLIFLASITRAQPPVKFDVVSIKPSDPASREARMNIDVSGSLTMLNEPLRYLITYAYDIRGFQLTGAPGWVETDRFDVLAKSQDGPALVREKIRGLLAERFGLIVHHETKEQTVYLLTLAKDGLRMKNSADTGPQRGVYRNGPGRAQGFAATTAMLARELAGMTGRAVIDKTGPTGKYDWTLEWAPDAEDTTRPSLFTALPEQLGVKLETARKTKREPD
ncbi:MAG TPA: TIGR03435 family protein [Bryobacteraceae bacterium]|nr:TIGR03435 family protein [Bryobacteraceae bacterium]